MKTLVIAALSALNIATSFNPCQTRAQESETPDFPLILLKEFGGEIAFDRIRVRNGSEEVIDDPGVISVILPVSEGVSANLVRQADRKGSIIASNSNGIITLRYLFEDGTSKALPGVDHRTLRSYRIRVNVTGGSGRRQAYVVDGYDSVKVDDGPVMDLFRGQIPMEPGDFSITMETRVSLRPQEVSGEAGYVIEDRWIIVEGAVSGGKGGKFIFDTGASGGLVVCKSALPPDTRIDALTSIAYSKGGVKKGKGVMEGSTGPVDDDNFLGRARGQEFVMGSMKFQDIEVNVLDHLPEFLSRIGVIGIIGIDIIRSSQTISLHGLSSGKGVIVFGEPGVGAQEGWDFSIPYQSAGNLLFVQGHAGSTPARFLLDTGARYSLFTRQFIETNRIAFRPSEEVSTAGIAGEMKDATKGTVDSIKLAGIEAWDLEAMVSDHFSATERMGLEGNSCILGMSFFNRFNNLTINFDDNMLHLRKE